MQLLPSFLMSCSYCPYCNPRKIGLASKQKVQLIKKEGKYCIEGAKYAAKKYLPPPLKMCGVTFHCEFPFLHEMDTLKCGPLKLLQWDLKHLNSRLFVVQYLDAQ